MVALLLFCGSIFAQNNDGVIITLKSGQELHFFFTSKPCIGFGQELTITASDSTMVSYDYEEVRSIRYGTYIPTGIEDATIAETPTISFKIINGTLYVYGLSENEAVSVYTLNGQRIAFQRQINDGAVLTIPLSSNGVLVIRTTTGISYKVLNP